MPLTLSIAAYFVVAAAILLAVLVITPVLTAQPDEPENLGRPITLNLRDADLDDVLANFSKISGRRWYSEIWSW